MKIRLEFVQICWDYFSAAAGCDLMMNTIRRDRSGSALVNQTDQVEIGIESAFAVHWVNSWNDYLNFKRDSLKKNAKHLN